MMVCASLNVAERAGPGISADAAIRMNGKAHDTTACTFAGRPSSRFAHGNSSGEPFYQACDEPCRGMPQFFFRYGAEPRKVVTLRLGGGDAP